MVYRRTERSERIRAESRTRILAAARRLFSRKGFDATTVQDIVAGAHTSVGNVYFYFKDKAEILQTLLEEALRATWARTDPILAAAPPGATRLAILVFTNAHSIVRADASLTRIVVASEEHAGVRAHILAMTQARLRTFLADVVTDDTELDLAVTAWSGAAYAFVERALIGSRGDHLLDDVAYLLRWNLRGLGVDDAEIHTAVAAGRRALTTVASASGDSGHEVVAADPAPKRRAAKKRGAARIVRRNPG